MKPRVDLFRFPLTISSALPAGVEITGEKGLVFSGTMAVLCRESSTREEGVFIAIIVSRGCPDAISPTNICPRNNNNSFFIYPLLALVHPHGVSSSGDTKYLITTTRQIFR